MKRSESNKEKERETREDKIGIAEFESDWSGDEEGEPSCDKRNSNENVYFVFCGQVFIEDEEQCPNCQTNADERLQNGDFVIGFHVFI